jgi:hypothetical protein
MISRVAAAALAVAVVLGMTTGCQPEPTPSPSGPVFANEEEAFAAAEETYRAYVDALNQVDLSDPETFEAVYAWTTGEANANERKTLTQMHADNWHVSGTTAISGFHGKTAELGNPAAVVAIVCSDVTKVSVVDEDGQSMVSDERPDVYALSVKFVESEATATGFAVAASNAVEDKSCT